MIDIQKKRRHGPEPKPLAEKRRHRVGIYFSDAEFELLLKFAFPNGTVGLTDQAINRGISRYLRDASLGTLPPSIPAINQEAWYELSKANSNLNQVMKFANETGNFDLSATAIMINQAVREFRSVLIGVRGDKDEA